jgi:response regulator RpfG family c-di-GMP phosphodiesterase
VIETYLAVKDLQVRDQIRMAFRLNPAFRISTVPPGEVIGVIAESPQVDLLVTDAGENETLTDDVLGRIREANPRTNVVLVADRGDGTGLNRAKLSQSVQTVIATPIDPFDLARRIFRLHAVLTGKRTKV